MINTHVHIQNIHVQTNIINVSHDTHMTLAYMYMYSNNLNVLVYIIHVMYLMYMYYSINVQLYNVHVCVLITL